MYIYAVNDPMSMIDPFGLKTTFTMHTAGAGLGWAVEGGLAYAMTKSKDGKCYEAWYIVGGSGFIVGAELKGLDELLQIIMKIGKGLIGSTFTTEDDYPPSYLSYLDVEGPKGSALYSLTLVDIELGPYEGGRKPDSYGRSPIWSHGLTGDVGGQLTKAVGINLIRWGEPREVCCNE